MARGMANKPTEDNASNQTSHDRGPTKEKAATTTQRKSSSIGYRERPVSVSDDHLIALASVTKTETDWATILLSARAGPGRWKTHHTAGDAFTVYTRQESHRVGVLAVGLVRGGAGEIMNVLQCATSAQYAQQMAGVFDDQFKDGSFVYHVPRRTQIDQKYPSREVQLVDVAVKTVTFHKTGWLGPCEEWCYLDAVYRHGTTGVAEKLMTTLDPKAIVAGLSSGRTKQIHGIACAYLLLPEDKPQSTTKDATHTSNQDENDHEDKAETKKAITVVKQTRVHFHGEFLVPKRLGLPVPSSLLASDKAIKQRLLRLADSCARLDVLVRRQRLGVQDVVDVTRVLPPTNTPCRVCTTMLLVAKICRLCGMGVCTNCSQKHERAVLSPDAAKGPASALRVHTIRVCADCMYRVDRACYDNLTPASLRGPHIVPDAIDTPLPTTALRGLLHAALVQAPSPSRKASVMSVIKCVLDQEAADSSSSSTSTSTAPSSPLLTPTSSERDYLDALEYLDVEHVPHERAQCRTHEGERCYRVGATDPDAALDAPVSDHEDARLRAVAQVDLDELADSVELNLLCHLAAKEMGCSTSTISIFDRDSLHCVATNVDAYARLQLPRWNTICAHTILDKRPHLIPHPEADIRMADALVVSGYGVRFYFAFPVVDADSGEIIGSYCVMNERSQAITASQFSAFKKLAETCNKIVRVHIETVRRRRDESSATNNSNIQSPDAHEQPSR